MDSKLLVMITVFVYDLAAFALAVAAELRSSTLRRACWLHTKYRRMFTQTPLCCKTVRKGVFAAGSAFNLSFFFTGIVSVFYYINYSRASDSFQPYGGEAGVAMGTYK